jgi:hypothetical protein
VLAELRAVEDSQPPAVWLAACDLRSRAGIVARLGGGESYVVEAKRRQGLFKLEADIVGQSLFVYEANRLSPYRGLARRVGEYRIRLIQLCDSFRIPGVRSLDHQPSDVLWLCGLLAFFGHLQTPFVRAVPGAL